MFSLVKFLNLEFDSFDFVPATWVREINGKLYVPYPKERTTSFDYLKRGSDSQPKSKWKVWEVEVIKNFGKITTSFVLIL